MGINLTASFSPSVKQLLTSTSQDVVRICDALNPVVSISARTVITWPHFQKHPSTLDAGNQLPFLWKPTILCQSIPCSLLNPCPLIVKQNTSSCRRKKTLESYRWSCASSKEDCLAGICLSSLTFFFIINQLINFWLHWIFVAMHAFPQVVVCVLGGRSTLTCSVWAFHCSGSLLQSTNSRVWRLQ